MPDAAKLGDVVQAMDTHIVMVSTPGGPVPTPMQLPFAGKISGDCSTDVTIEGAAAAVAGSTASNLPRHVPPGNPFQSEPTNKGEVVAGSATVLINGKPAARAGDPVNTCNDPVPAPNGRIQAVSTVKIGG
jgi:uncharacterized Zn-binding protein involved in type VI secretion